MNDPAKKTARSRFGSLLAGTFGILILAAGIFLAWWWLTHRPKAQPRQRPHRAPLVDVMSLAPTNLRVRVEAMGTISTADEAALQAEVSARIEWVHPELEEGGYVTNGTVLIRLDPREYQYLVDQRKATLAGAEGDFRIEMGRQDIARQELDMLSEGGAPSEMDRELALREPQLHKAEASVEAAQAALAGAELNLERTRIRAPFDAWVTEAPADIGDRASPGATLVKLVGADRFRAIVSVRVEDVNRLSFNHGEDSAPTRVPVRAVDGIEWEGFLDKRLPGLDPAGRMARVRVSIPNSTNPQAGPGDRRIPLLDEFVRAEIPGEVLEDVVRVPRTALRDGASLWLLDPEKKLRIVSADIRWSGTEDVFVRHAFPAGSRLVVSTIGTPVEGMSLALEGERPRGTPGGKPGKQPGGQPGKPPGGGQP